MFIKKVNQCMTLCYMCRHYKNYGGGRGREYAYLHEEEPPSGPLNLDRTEPDIQAASIPQTRAE